LVKVRFSKIAVLIRLSFYLAKFVFIASILIGYRFWLFGVLVVVEPVETQVLFSAIAKN
jgi:hypothetical protein